MAPLGREDTVFFRNLPDTHRSASLFILRKISPITDLLETIHSANAYWGLSWQNYQELRENKENQDIITGLQKALQIKGSYQLMGGGAHEGDISGKSTEQHYLTT